VGLHQGAAAQLARERPDGFDGPGDLIGRGLARQFVMRTDAPDDFEALFQLVQDILGHLMGVGEMSPFLYGPQSREVDCSSQLPRARTLRTAKLE
jgi:hypothetical protein